MPKSLRTKGEGQVEIVDSPIPTPGEGQILVKNVAAAQNPIDWQCIYDYYVPANIGATIGNDYAGTVVSVGPNVTRYKPGDRVAGFVFGNLNHPEYPSFGALAEYVIGEADISLKVPDSLSFEDAATLGTAVTTIGQSLYQSLGLKLPTKPSKEKIPILIYGGSSAMGSLALQMAKLSGYKVITTASPKNFDFVKAMGADEIFDYHDPDVVAKIKAATDNKLAIGFNTICRPGTTEIVTESYGPTGGQVHNLQYLDMSPFRKDVVQSITVGYSALGKDYLLKGIPFSSTAKDREYVAKFWKIVEDLLAQGKLKTHPVRVAPGGLAGVFEGLNQQKEWKLSAEKLVYVIADTPGLEA